MGSDLEEVVDIKSSMAYLLVKWKLIVLAAVICALIGGSFAMVKRARLNKPGTSEVTYEEKVEKARKSLQESDAIYLEQLSSQYKEYGARLNDWNDYVKQSALQGMDPYNYTKRDIQYIVTSDSHSAVDSFAASLLNQEDYDKLGELMGYDPLVAALQDLIIAANVSQLSSSEFAPATASEVSVQEVVNTAEGYSVGILNVTCIINDESAADGVQAVVDEAVKRKCAAMQKTGLKITAEKGAVTTSRNDASWLINKQQIMQQQITTLQTNRSNLIKNSVDTLSDAHKAYFNLLIKDEADGAVTTSASSAKAVNVKKYVLAGGLGGLLLALAAVYLSFVFSEKIRSEEELSGNFKLPVLHRFTVGKAAAGADVIRNKGLAVLGAPQGAETEGKGTSLLRTELERRLSGTDGSNVYIAYDWNDERAAGAMKALASGLSGEKMTVAAGNPGTDETDCQELLKSDAVVIAETLNVSGKRSLKNLMEICRRNGIQILGCVTLFDAAKY